MSYQAYVFNSEQRLIEDIEQYKQLGGDVSSIKVLIRDVEHGRLLSAAGYHHIDYLNEITAANRGLPHHSDEEITYVAGITTGQITPTVVNGLYEQEEHYALEALAEYGLENNQAYDALQALRTGHYLLLVPEAYRQQTEQHQLSGILSASFGNVWNSHISDSSAEAQLFQNAQQRL